jgi:hypothetical protein
MSLTFTNIVKNFDIADNEQTLTEIEIDCKK